MAVTVPPRDIGVIGPGGLFTQRWIVFFEDLTANVQENENTSIGEQSSSRSDYNSSLLSNQTSRIEDIDQLIAAMQQQLAHQNSVNAELLSRVEDLEQFVVI